MLSYKLPKENFNKLNRHSQMCNAIKYTCRTRLKGNK